MIFKGGGSSASFLLAEKNYDILINKAENGICSRGFPAD